MEETTRIYQAIAAVSRRVNDLAERLDMYINMLYERNASNIDYLSMMSDIDLTLEEIGLIEPDNNTIEEESVELDNGTQSEL